MKPKPCLIVALLLLQGVARAHGPDHETILLLTAELGKRPGDPELLLQRGERLRVHGDLAAARLDFQSCLTAVPDSSPARLRLAMVLRDLGESAEALSLLDSIVGNPRTNLTALATRADLLCRTGRHQEAVADYDAILTRTGTPRPDLYLDRARAILAAGTNSETLALAGIDEGLRRLGPVPSLQLFALDLDQARGAWREALTRLDALQAGSTRKERWLYRRGEILRTAGRHAEARREYQRALAAIDALPERLRRTIATGELRTDIEARLAAGTAATEGSNP
jgi:tetratricopeptide (TPR) repeat protein